MHRIKAPILVALLVIALTSVVMGISYIEAPRLSPEVISESQSMVRDILDEKLLNAEASLLRQSRMLASDEKVLTSLTDVRQKLLSSSPEELKKTNNKWNEDIFNGLLTWRAEQTARLSRDRAEREESEQSERMTATELYQIANWWKRSPDLLLAFADLPLADDTHSSILVGYGADGKMMRAGKRYDEEIESLKTVQTSNTTIVGLFAWDSKMYFAAISPITKDDVQLGQVVVGMEMSRESLNAFSASMPRHLSLMMYYMRQGDGSPAYKYISDANEEMLSRLRSADFRSFNEYNDKQAPTMGLEAVQDGNTYVGEVGENLIAFSKSRWMWNDGQEVGFYILSDMDAAGRRWAHFRSSVLIAGLLFLLLGLAGAFVIGARHKKRLNALKDALLEGINSGNPLNPEAFSCLPGIEDANLGTCVIKTIDDNDESNADMNNLLSDLDLDDERNASVAIPAITDVDPELRALYEDYIDKRRETGKDVDMPFDQFVRRMNRNRDKIEAAHPGAKVKFSVSIQNGKAVLTPTLIK